MGQQLRVCTALAKDLSSVASIHVGCSQMPTPPVSERSEASGLSTYAHTHKHTHTHN